MNVDINVKSEGDVVIGNLSFGQRQVASISADRIVVGKTRGLGIGAAVNALHDGQRVARAGWNGKGMQLELQVPDAHSKMTQPYAYLVTLKGDRVPWTCSQADLLARDWEIVS